ncbi:MAG: tyrosine-type recombinase/integrase [Ruminococcus sp.]
MSRLRNRYSFSLLDYLKNHRPDVRSEYIFINTVTNSAFTSAKILTQIVYKNFEKAGIERRYRKRGAHTLRHSLATTMLANNTPVPVITGVLGHASSRTTQKYLSIDVDGLRKVSLEVPE